MPFLMTTREHGLPIGIGKVDTNGVGATEGAQLEERDPVVVSAKHTGAVAP